MAQCERRRMVASEPENLHERMQPMNLLPRFRSLIAGLLVLCGVPFTRAAQPEKPSSANGAVFRVASFNVRNSNAQDGENAWPKRTDLFFDTTLGFKSDLIGFQEVLAVQYDEIVKRLSDYGFCGVARDDGKRKGEWSMVAYRKSRFEAVDQGDFWLSETPTVIGSKSWDAALTRICSWVRLREKTTGQELVFANTHFDHKGVVARQEASRVLSKQLSEIAKGVPAILVGDFNINEDNPAYAVLVRPDTPGAIAWIDAFRSVHPKRTPEESSFHAFKGGSAGSRIDFIFHTKHFTATESEIDRTVRDGRYPSDHYAVTAVLRLK
jgi:endonuclease/exonuclease/phosphatase family metal-dependent hydrolase